MPEMRRVTVRFGESLWDLIEEEANRDGVSAAQYIRDAALGRAMWQRTRRGEDWAIDTRIREIVQGRREVADDEERLRVIEDVLQNARPELEQVIDKLPPESAALLRRWYGL